MLFVIVLLFTPTRAEPILVPVFAVYAGLIARLILDVGFWYVLVRRRLPHQHATEVNIGILVQKHCQTKSPLIVRK